MAKLITDHDPFHVHKILGVFALLHFVYRFGLWIWRDYGFCQYGNENCTPQDVRWDVVCILLHGLLSWSSLLLPLPAKRNFQSPMIWREFRWHSIIFATRHVIASVLACLQLWPQQHWLLNFFSKLGLVMATCTAADAATAVYGCREKRTTNAMPYPAFVTPAMIKGIKLNYAVSQFNATLLCLLESPDLAWAPLIAIQGAPLLMTLVRKGKVTALFYHVGYSLQLMTPVVVFEVANAVHYQVQLRYQFTALFVIGSTISYLRMQYRLSKWMVWMVGVGLIDLVMRHTHTQEQLRFLDTVSPFGFVIAACQYAVFLLRQLGITQLSIRITTNRIQKKA